jgi:hypothetical protein
LARISSAGSIRSAAELDLGEPLGEVGDRADGGDLEAAVAGDDRLVHGRHADGVGAEHAERADLGGRLERRAHPAAVDALGEGDAGLGRGRAQCVEQARVIGVAHRREARADGVVVGTAQDADPGEVDVVGDRHQAGWADLGA